MTYVATGEGWLYLASVMDLYSRKIVGWHMSDRMTKELVLQALKHFKSNKMNPFNFWLNGFIIYLLNQNHIFVIATGLRTYDIRSAPRSPACPPP